MMLITAVVKPFKVEDVKDALKDAGVHGMTVTEVKGFGRQSGHTEVYRGAEYTVDFLPKVKFEVIVAPEDAERIADVIATASHTGKIGDGKLWMIDLTAIRRLRTGERDLDAI
jgi:nitrogen regulatory protein PII